MSELIKILGRSEYNPNSQMPLSGVEYHRQYMPFEYLSNTGAITHNFDNNNLTLNDGSPVDLSIYDLYHVVRKDVRVDKDGNWSDAHNITKAKAYGLPTIIDFDDHWTLDSTHALYNYYKRNNVAKLSIDWLQRCDAVTCTTERLASHIRKYHSNVTVIPNTIHPLLEQFVWSIADLEPREKVNIGWVGSLHHVNDITMLAEFFRKYWLSALPQTSSMVMGGYVEGQTNYQLIANIMAGNKNNPLEVMNALPATAYAKMYQHIDIALAPLADNEFNRCKSELKIIEAGHFGIPVIASDVYPYNTVIKHGVNGYLIKNSKDSYKQWLKYVNILVNEPAHRFHMGQNLKQTILKDFNIKDSSQKRLTLYRELCK